MSALFAQIEREIAELREQCQHCQSRVRLGLQAIDALRKPRQSFLSVSGELIRPCLVDTSSIGHQGRIAAGGGC
jgi:hypothetical protein